MIAAGRLFSHRLTPMDTDKRKTRFPFLHRCTSVPHQWLTTFLGPGHDGAGASCPAGRAADVLAFAFEGVRGNLPRVRAVAFGTKRLPSPWPLPYPGPLMPARRS